MRKTLLLLSLIALSAEINAQSWVNQATNLTQSHGVKEMSIVNANTVWISSYDGSGGGTYPKVVAKTVNGGTTWTPITVSGPPSAALISDIYALDANTAWVATAPSSGTNGNGIWKTTNGGSTWTKQTAYSTSSFANIVYFWDENNGFSAGDPVAGKFEILKTSNGGTTWTAVSTAPTPTSSDEYGYVGIKKVVGDNIWMGTSLGRILRSNDRGATWAANFSPVLDFGGNIVSGSSGKFAFKDANNGLLIAVDNSSDAVLYSTSDGGANWEPVEPVGQWYFGDIAFVPGTLNTYVSTGINFNDDSWMGSAYSTDGGVTWSSIDTGEQRGKVVFLNPTTGWAGQFSDGASGTKGILKFNGDLSLAVSEVSAKSNLKIFPNPAVDVVKLSADKEIKSVNIFDASGKKIKSYNDAKEINVSNLAKGTYILQAYYGNGAVENTKLIKK